MKKPPPSIFYRVLAERHIRLPGIRVFRWVSLGCELTENTLSVENEVLIRSANKHDLDLMADSEDKADPENHILLQDIRFWNEYGFRCLYAGHTQNDPKPFCLCYFIENFDNYRFKAMEYRAMYEPIDSKTVQVEGGYVRKNMRRKNLFLKFCQKRNRLFYQKGKAFVRSHVLLDKKRLPMLKISKKVGFVPDHLISRISIDLPLVRANVFVHHPIKKSDLRRFPLALFYSENN